MIDHGKLTAREGKFRIATGGAVTDTTLLGVATEYENTVMRKIIALTPDDLVRRSAGDEAVLQTTKYDGEGVFIYFEKGKDPFAFSAPAGRVRTGFPALDRVAAKLDSAGIGKALLRAELWLPPTKGGRRRGIADVIRTSFSGTEAEVAEFKLVLLDLIMLDGRDLRARQTNFKETWDQLETLFGTDETAAAFRMGGSLVPDKDVAASFERALSSGSEGLVVRRLGRFDVLKIKPYRNVDAVVIGYVEGEFEGLYGITSLLTALTYPAEAGGELWLQTFVRAGTGFSDEQRTGLLPQLQAMKVDAPLAMTDSDGRTVHFVKPQLIAELGGEDLVTTTGKSDNRTQLLSWDKAAGRYTFHALTTVPRLTFARFLRLREDKDLSHGGARMEQILDSPTRPEIRPVSKREARTLRRCVYTKQEMVRKLVIAENGVTEGAFPYVVFWTDFSAKRADPLKVSTAYAHTEERARQLGEKLIAENITKGWVLTSESCSEAAVTETPAVAELAATTHAPLADPAVVPVVAEETAAPAVKPKAKKAAAKTVEESPAAAETSAEKKPRATKAKKPKA